MTKELAKKILTESLINELKHTHKCTWLDYTPAQAKPFVADLTFDKLNFEKSVIASCLFHDEAGINYLVAIINKKDILILKIERIDS